MVTLRGYLANTTAKLTTNVRIEGKLYVYMYILYRHDDVVDHAVSHYKLACSLAELISLTPQKNSSLLYNSLAVQT